MSTNSWPDEIGPLLRPLQIVVAALTAGCLIFMVIAIFLVQTGQAPAADNDFPPIITYAALGFAGAAIVLRMVVPKMIESRARKRIAYLVEQSPLALAAGVVMIIGVALNFPTRSSAAHWIEDQLAAVEQFRQFGQ